ncbi:winged helix-turn-helix domain-containing protein [Methanolobus sp.]|uniref:helix-turn-helix transcriptional regulator n=1 Tax=Methanolobus sp. TaxID=1874737 RepID=UPI0025EA2DE7|nr:winged helix-turn-helix domain-containing protein [Methanolobus sp.]
MRRTLLESIFMSEKRKIVLLLLQEGPKDIEYLMEYLDTTRTALLPQLNVLQDSHLITKEGNMCELTTLGKLVVSEMAPLISTVATLESDLSYWGSHRMDFIPPHLLERLYELGECKFVKPTITDMMELNREFMENTYSSKSLFTITTFLHPNFIEIYSGLADKGVEVSVILSDDLFRKVTKENPEGLRHLIKSARTKFYVYDRPMNFITFSMNDHASIFRLLTTSGDYDGVQLFSSFSGTVRWGREFFEWYLQDSTPVSEVQVRFPDTVR